MASEIPITCPYCNTVQTVSAQEAAGRRLVCQRCGETIPFRPAAGAPPGTLPPPEAGDQLTAEPSPQAGSPPPGPAPRPSNRLLAAGILTVMGLMATAALVFALLTQRTRREHDRATEAATQPAFTVRSLPPARRPELGYLPADVNLVAGVNVTEALQTPAGRDFLARSRFSSTAGSTLQSWTGLRLEDLDYAVAGVALDDPSLKVVLAAETVQPVDEGKLREKLKNSSAPAVALRSPSPRSVILTYPEKEMEEVPKEPAPEPKLPAALQSVLQERVGGGAVLWVVGHAEHWDQPLVRLLLGSLSPDRQEVLGKVTTFALWVQLDEQATLNGSFECADEASAGKLIDLLGRQTREGVKLSKAREGSWVTIQARGSVEAVLGALDRGPPEEEREHPRRPDGR